MVTTMYNSINLTVIQRDIAGNFNSTCKVLMFTVIIYKRKFNFTLLYTILITLPDRRYYLLPLSMYKSTIMQIHHIKIIL
jgi:hypothetical protein